MNPLPAPARPFLKWAGGKTQLLAPIARLLPRAIEGTYFEPFLGGGAVFFHLRSEGRLRGGAVLSDSNEVLIETWLAVRDDTEALLDLLLAHRNAHERDARSHYYSVRAAAPTSPTERAARLLYLNKTCFNGLWRVNSRGLFNVPMGRYKRPTIHDPEALRSASAALQGVDIRCVPWHVALKRAKANRGDAVYLDPPYVPVSRTASFTSYTAERFGPGDQEALAKACAGLATRGVPFLLSNSNSPDLRDLYKGLGLRVRSRAARRAINSKGALRGDVRELLITA